MKYPILYKSNETDFFAMGLGPIQMLKATVTQERNGIFIFEGEILTDNPLFPLVLENYIIKADADHLLKDQRFRIKRIVPNHDGKAQIYAEHVSYLSRELTIKPEVNITGSAQIALNQWKASIVESNPFIVSSDITTSASTKWRIDKVSNPMMALGGVEGSILDRWGGEYLFDNYHISLLKKRGKTATNILAYGRNITDFEQERNILSTYTSIAPYAIYTDDNEKETIVTVDGFVVDSEHVNKFPNRVTKPIDFSSEFGSGEIPTKARLTTLAQQYIADNEIGVPTTSIKISFLDLSQTADYAEYAFLEQVNLCDDVRVHYPKLGVNTIAKVVRVVWNCLTESYDEVEIGQKRMSLASQIQEQNKVIQEINTQTSQAQVSADGKNMIFYGLYGANGLGQPTATKIGDSWFKPNGLETELYVWTGIEWKLIMSTSSFSEINETIKDLDGELELATTNANEAVNKAGQAIRDAGFATDIAEDAKALGVTASTLADEAKTNASTAMADAQEAIRQAGITGGVATEARRLAGLAEDNAQEALTKANTSVTDASKALTDATKAFNKSFKSSSVAYTTSTNGTTPPTTGWGTTVPSPSPDVYIWTRTTIVLNDNTPVVSYSVGKIGAKGDQGLKGDIGGQGIQGVPGANAPTIKSVVQQRYLSTSKTSQTGGSWLDTVPVWSSDKYYWIRVVTTYSNNATSQSTPVLDNALNDSLVTALEAKTANQTLSTTVTQHATLIQGKANSTTVDAIEGRVTTTEGSISAVAGEVALKASAEDVNALTGRVSTAEGNITTQAGQIALKADTKDVNALTGRVSTAEGKITTQAGQIELKASTKDVNALTGRVTTAEGNITTQAGQIALRATTATVNALTGRVSAAESSLSVQSGKIDLAATKTELTTAIDGIQVGGRNLLIQSNKRNWGNASYKIAESSSWRGWFAKVEPNTKYTLSRTDLSNNRFRLYWLDAEPYLGMSLMGLEQNYDNQLIVEGIISKDSTKYVFIYLSNNGDFTNNIKLEKGNKATDWTPAPEDVDKSISTVQANLTVEADKIASKVSQTDFNALNGRVGTAETTITQHAASINLRATKTELTTAIDGIEIGGRNLIRALNSNNYSGIREVKEDGVVIRGKVGAGKTLVALYKTKTSSGDHTFSYAMKEGSSHRALITIYDENENVIENKSISGWIWNVFYKGYYRVINNNGSAIFNAPSETRYIAGTMVPPWLEPIGNVTLLWMKLEKGNKATDWTPAPEDVDASITTVQGNLTVEAGKITALTTKTNGHTTQIGSLESSYTGLSSTVTALETGKVGTVAFSALEQNLAGFKTTVQNTYADKTTVTALANQWTQTTNLANGHTGQISNLGTQINLRLTQKQVLDEISKDKEVIDTRNTNERPQWYWDNYPRTVIKELKLCAVMGLPAEAGEFATVVTDTSWSRYGVGAVTQTAIVNSGQYQRKSTSGTVWDYWAKIADTSNVLAQINLSTEGILIQGKKIQITGETYIQNAVIKTAHIADLAVSGAKIANASISSAKIISLDASKITTNTLSAITTNTGDLNISGNLTMSTDNSIISGSYDFKEDVGEAYNPRKFIGTSELVQRYMVFKGGIYTPTNTHLGYAETYFGLDFFKMRWYNSQSEKQLRGRIDMNHGQIEFGDTFGRPHTIIGSEDIYFGRGLSANRIYATADWPSFLINEHNTNGIMGIRLTNDNHGFGTFSKNNNLASINVGGDGKPRVWFERGVYDRTYSASANMFVTEAGTIGRAVSARKYKTDIQSEYLSKSKNILQISPSSWYDKEALRKGKEPKRYYGFIADEFHELGLTEVVQYGADGQVEGLAYDRISMYHNVILRDHEQQLATVTQQLNSVSNSRLQETLLLESRLLSLQKTVEQLQQEIEQLRTA